MLHIDQRKDIHPADSQTVIRRDAEYDIPLIANHGLCRQCNRMIVNTMCHLCCNSGCHGCNHHYIICVCRPNFLCFHDCMDDVVFCHILYFSQEYVLIEKTGGARIYIFTDDSRHIVALTQCCQLLENCRMVTERAADTEQNAFIFHCSVSPLYIPR